ncbi:MAG TPA: aminotransferase class V-fold PLP-dependent enzyme, partial [Planctomycetaceae bacterium]|nr:aminotransferase class V-fold PLP-dependent enzyme [Planctomycetaceae bacterium]
MRDRPGQPVQSGGAGASAGPVRAQPALDMDWVRGEFPVLSRTVHDGVPLVYLDNAATSQKPQCVIDVLSEYYRSHVANVHRGIHTLAEEATEAYEGARARVAELLNSPEPNCIVFTRGTTDAINLVAWSWARTNLRAGQVIVATRMEHHSNLLPWQQVAQLTGARFELVPLTADGRLQLEALERILRCCEVRLVAVTAVSNVLGTVNPIER